MTYNEFTRLQVEIEKELVTPANRRKLERLISLAATGSDEQVKTIDLLVSERDRLTTERDALAAKLEEVRDAGL